MKKLRLDIEEISVETFAMSEESAELGTVQGQQVALDGTFLSLCNTCDVNAATCGASCGPACTPTRNTPDCYTPYTTPCGRCRVDIADDVLQHEQDFA